MNPDPVFALERDMDPELNLIRIQIQCLNLTKNQNASDRDLDPAHTLDWE